jgi:hypothetical protein
MIMTAGNTVQFIAQSWGTLFTMEPSRKNTNVKICWQVGGKGERPSPLALLFKTKKP